MRSVIIALALIGTAAGVASAQTTLPSYPTNPPKGGVHVDSEGYLRDGTGAIVDKNANRVIGSNTAHPGPGDYGQPPASNERMYPSQPSVAAAPPPVGALMPANRSPAMTDEYGFRYDAQGNRIDAMGNIISPQTK